MILKPWVSLQLRPKPWVSLQLRLEPRVSLHRSWSLVPGYIGQQLSLSLHASPVVSSTATSFNYFCLSTRHLILALMPSGHDCIQVTATGLNFLLLIFLHIRSWRQNQTWASKSCRIAECSFSYWLVVFPPPALSSMVCHLVDKWLAMAPPYNHSTNWRGRRDGKFWIILFLCDWPVVTSGGKVTLQYFRRMWKLITMVYPNKFWLIGSLILRLLAKTSNIVRAPSGKICDLFRMVYRL